MKKTFAIILISFLLSCSTDSESESNNLLLEESFDRQAMLVNLTENIIVPSLTILDSKLSDLRNKLDVFTSDTSLASLLSLRTSFVDAYKSWQYVEMFNIGKAEEIYYAQKMNVYPSNVDRIDSNTYKSDLDLDAGRNEFSAQGFPAVDFMLYGIAESDSEIITKFTEENGRYLSYLNTVIDKMISNTTLVLNDWMDNKTEFVNSFDNNAASSLNMLVNDYVYYYEKGLRTNKFGIPAGRWALKRSQNVEAFYAKTLSKTLATEALTACRNFFTGTSLVSNQIQGDSFKTYLEFLEESNEISNEILNSFDNSQAKMELLQDNFYHIVENDNIKLLEVFQKLQEGVILLKTDMISIMDIGVDYMDADGD